MPTRLSMGCELRWHKKTSVFFVPATGVLTAARICEISVESCSTWTKTQPAGWRGTRICQELRVRWLVLLCRRYRRMDFSRMQALNVVGVTICQAHQSRSNILLQAQAKLLGKKGHRVLGTVMDFLHICLPPHTWLQNTLISAESMSAHHFKEKEAGGESRGNCRDLSLRLAQRVNCTHQTWRSICGFQRRRRRWVGRAELQEVPFKHHFLQQRRKVGPTFCSMLESQECIGCRYSGASSVSTCRVSFRRPCIQQTSKQRPGRCGTSRA
eukprot:284815964_6